MRIRKNARLISSSSSSSSFLVCQLNRSPWDVVDSTSLQKGEWEDGFGVNGNFVDAFPSSESFPSGESMELSFEYVEKTQPPPQPPLPREVEETEYVGGDYQIGGCNNADRKNGWQHIHHQLKPPPLKVAVGPPLPPIPTPPKKRGRPKKPTTTATPAATTTTNNNNNSNSNPYEYYYYSGFGPSWGKRRGGNNSKDIDIGNDNNDAEHSLGSSSTSLVMSEDDKDEDVGDNKVIDHTTSKPSTNIVVMESIVDDELDYIEDDFDDDDDDEISGGRRVRKPVKARSLKSLM